MSVCYGAPSTIERVIRSAAKGELPGIDAFELCEIHGRGMMGGSLKAVPRSQVAALFQKGCLELEGEEVPADIQRAVAAFLNTHNFTRNGLLAQQHA